MQRFELTPGDDGYPVALASLHDAPPTLYGIGDPALLVPGLAIVGARKATPYGLKTADLFAGWAATQGISVISGAAMGCDQAAHVSALKSGGPTVAVLACGADVDYPSGAASLLARIRDQGCVVSEAPWGSAPLRWMFVRRNRIIAGLAYALLVVEASLPSGTFSTADFALAAGREVYAVPGSIFAPESFGCNRLIRQGATPVCDVSDLASSLGIHLPANVRPIRIQTDDPLLRALVSDPMRPDDAARLFGLDVIEVCIRLANLESQRLVARYPDGRYGPA